jgi:protein O-mannosyl-transferase
MRGSRKQLWIGLLLAAGTAILYWPIRGHGFIGFDDNEYLVQNWHIHSGLTWRALAWAFQSGYASNWHPLTWISHMLDCQFFGLNPAGHHLTSLIIHSLNSVLLFLLLKQMTRATWRSAFVAALFAWHPLHVESVAWAAERKDLLCAFFWILTLMAYTQYARRKTTVERPARGRGPGFYYGVALVLFAMALMSKPMAVTLPCVLLLLDFWPLQRFAEFNNFGSVSAEATTISPRLRVLLLEKLPFFLLAIIASIITFKVQQAGGAVDALASNPFSMRVENAFLGYAGYILKTFWPVNLSVLYPLSFHLPMGLVLGSVLLFVLACVGAFRVAKRFPYVFSGWFWFAGTLVPVIGIVQVGAQAMADRYTYIPSIGLFIAIVWAAAALLEKVPQAKNVFAGAGALVLVAFFVLARHQLGYWQNGEILFKHAIAVTRDNYRACSALSTSLDQEGHKQEAIKVAEDAVRMQPNYPEGHYNLGTLLSFAGKTDEAIAQFETALVQNPRFADAENNLGTAFLRKGKLDDALAHLSAANRLSPNDPEILCNLGSVLLAQSKLPEAGARFSEAIRLMPECAGAHGDLGVVLMRLGHAEQGTVELAEYVRLQPNDPGARLNYGLALLDQNKAAEAAAQFNEVLRLEPDSSLAHYRMGLALAGQGKSQEAIAQCREALRLQPDFPDARQTLDSWSHATN